MLENYCKTICIEARTMRSMAIKRIAPAIEKYTAELANNMLVKQKALPDIECRFEKNIIAELSKRTDRIYENTTKMVEVLNSLSNEDYYADSRIISDKLLPAMADLRTESDAAEMITSKSCWPLPNYGLLLFGEK